MAAYRIYTGSDGQSHLEEMETPPPGSDSPHVNAREIYIRTQPAGYFHDWHTSPHREYVVTLAGQLNIGLGDGTSQVFGPGDVFWAEDLTGRGHTSRVVGGQPRLAAVILLE